MSSEQGLGNLGSLSEAILREDLRRRASRKLIPFTEYTFPRYKTAIHHRAIARTLESVIQGKIDRLMILCCPRHGKQCAVETPILTTKGWKNHGDLHPGDYVFHPSGYPVRVLAVTEPAPQDVEVEFSNGEVLGCHENHEWRVIRRPNQEQVLETHAMEGRVWEGRKPRFRLPPVTKFADRRRIAITDIRRVEPHMGNCIQVDSDDGMYLAGRSLIPTHNSELASRRFPAFALGIDPTLHFISASATMPLAQDFGGEVRNIIWSPEYQEIFPDITLAEDTTAKNLWKTDQGGTYFATGVGGRPIGRGADIFMIDDPFGSMEDAESPTQRRKVQHWYQGTVYNRLQPGGKIVLINHRMHEDDLSAFLLNEEKNGGDQWFVLCMPAILNAEAAKYLGKKPGEALWPEAYPLEALDRIKRNSGKRAWAGLYMQEPKDAEDGIFDRNWFKLWPAGKPFPYFEFIVQSYDTAFTDETKNDPTAAVTIGIWIDNRKDTPVYNAMVIDAWSEHMDYPTLRKRMRTEYNMQYGASWELKDPFGQDGPTVRPDLEIHDLRNPMYGPQAFQPGGRRADMVLVEDKGSGMAVKQELNLAGLPIKGYQPGRRGKTSRANAMAIYAENGKVWIPENETRKGQVADWADDMVSQLCSFRFEGSIAHDDFVDSFCQALHQMALDGWLIVDEGKKDPTKDDHDPALKRRRTAA